MRIRLFPIDNNMNFALRLGIVLFTILPMDKRWCNALNEIAYTFRYSIGEAQVVMQHWEDRRGDIVHGGYSFLEPDGKVRVVHYQVTGSTGFKASVTYRNPPGYPLRGHLKYPIHYSHPVILARPVGFITGDLFKKGRSQANLPK